MRGSKWDSIKPLLKILQESFPCCIHVALIIKPDNFWQKQRTNFGSSKFEFEVNFSIANVGCPKCCRETRHLNSVLGNVVERSFGTLKPSISSSLRKLTEHKLLYSSIDAQEGRWEK